MTGVEAGCPAQVFQHQRETKPVQIAPLAVGTRIVHDVLVEHIYDDPFDVLVRERLVAHHLQYACERAEIFERVSDAVRLFVRQP